MPDTGVDFRTLPLPEVLRLFRENGEPSDPRPDIDTSSVMGRNVQQGQARFVNPAYRPMHGT